MSLFSNFSYHFKRISHDFLSVRNSNAVFTIFLLFAIVAYPLILAAYPAITFPWYFNTEEFPYIQEILRFVELDFRQQFFDIPGTPLMMVGTLLWSIYYWLGVILGYADPSQGIRYFSFEHMQSLYLLMRLLSYFLYALSIVLTYLIARRLTNSIGGYIAALLLAVSPIYGQTILYLRIESTNLFLVLLSVWLLLRALDSHSYRLYLSSGIVAGLAMAARFPSVLAVMPVLLSYCVVDPKSFTDKKYQRLNSYFFTGIVSILVFAGCITLLVKHKLLGRNLVTDVLLLTADGQYPNATNTIQKLWLLLLVVAVLFIFLHVLPKTRLLFKKIVHSSLTTICSGFLVGFLLGVPTILWSGNYFLASIENFTIRNRLGQSFIHNLFDVIRFYLVGLEVWIDPSIHYTEVGVAYTYWQAILLVAGLAIIFIKRKRIFYPVLVGAVIGILSQYGKLQTTRHLIAWLPYFLIIMALPIALVYERLRSLLKDSGQSYYAFSLAIVTFIFITTYRVQINSLDSIRGHFQEKTLLFPEMDRWLSENTTAQDRVFHTCCEPVNQEVILSWIQLNGVKVPAGIRKSEQSTIWFGDKEPLVKEGKGYIVISTTTFPGQYVDYYKKMRPESLTDPFTDSRFSLKKVIDPKLESGTTYRIYSFDFAR